MNIVQARLQIAIRTAYEEMLLGSKSPGLLIVIDQFRDVEQTYTIKHEVMARLVKHFNFHRHTNHLQEPSMLLAGVLYLQEKDLWTVLEGCTPVFQEAAISAALGAAIDIGLAVREQPVEMLLFNYSLTEALQSPRKSTIHSFKAPSDNTLTGLMMAPGRTLH